MNGRYHINKPCHVLIIVASKDEPELEWLAISSMKIQWESPSQRIEATTK
jgi:hypothetical protein